MLTRLALRDFVAAREVEVELESGFCALTGETGAGKSLLVDALALLAGGRASPSQIRDGATAAEVEAAFVFDDGIELIARRVIAKDAKKSRAFIDGRQTPLAMLAEKVSEAAEICGQHAHYSLLKPAAQRQLLDAYSGALADTAQVGVLHRRWRDAVASLTAAQNDAEQQTARREQLQTECAEIKALDFSPDRWRDANVRLSRLENAADLASGCQSVLAALEGEGGGEEKLSGALRTLRELAKKDQQLQASLEQTGAALQSVQESARDLRAYAQDITSDPRAFAECEQFVSEAHKLARKYRLTGPELLAECLRDKEEELHKLASAADVALMQKQEQLARKQLDVASASLSDKRNKTARKLETAIASLLPKLAMPDAKMKVQLTPLIEPAATGGERIEFLITTHKGGQWGGIQQVASGGELSRLGLALQIAGGDFRAAPTVVFDEVDAGIGGAAAAVVGQLLRQLGQTRQVLCVTHLAQVAAGADNHWRVRMGANRAVQVIMLDEKQRVEELARMSGGETITESARAHAAELRALATKQKHKKGL